MDPLVIVNAVVGSVSILCLVFWPIYDWMRRRYAKTQPIATKPYQEEHGIWECPVCGKKHRAPGRPQKSKSACPFGAGCSFASVSEDEQIGRQTTNLGVHFEYTYWVWEYNNKIFLTDESYDHSSVQRYENGEIGVSAYYSVLFCDKEKWRSDAKTKHEADRKAAELHDRILNSLYESDEYCIVGLNRILDAGVTQEQSCGKTGYVIWKGEQGINITGVRLDASPTEFNYDTISRGASIRRFDKSCTRKICDTIDDLRKMSQEIIDERAYGAYMSGAR